jgi:hypothetical protein
MRRKDRARRRALALTFAAAVHLALFAGIVLGRKPPPRFVELPAMTVALMSRPEPRSEASAAPPRRPRPRAVRQTPAPTPEPAPAPEPAAAAAVSDADRTALNQAVIRRPPPRGPKLRERCESGQYAPEDKEACLRILANARRTPTPDDEGGAFAAAKTRKDAIVRYKRSRRGDDFPGLLCAFGRPCTPYVPPKP